MKLNQLVSRLVCGSKDDDPSTPYQRVHSNVGGVEAGRQNNVSRPRQLFSDLGNQLESLAQKAKRFVHRATDPTLASQIANSHPGDMEPADRTATIEKLVQLHDIPFDTQFALVHGFAGASRRTRVVDDQRRHVAQVYNRLMTASPQPPGKVIKPGAKPEETIEGFGPVTMKQLPPPDRLLVLATAAERLAKNPRDENNKILPPLLEGLADPELPLRIGERQSLIRKALNCSFDNFQIGMDCDEQHGQLVKQEVILSLVRQHALGVGSVATRLDRANALGMVYLVTNHHFSGQSLSGHATARQVMPMERIALVPDRIETFAHANVEGAAIALAGWFSPLPGWNDADQVDRPYKRTPPHHRGKILSTVQYCLRGASADNLDSVARMAAAYLQHEVPAAIRDARAANAEDGANVHDAPDALEEEYRACQLIPEAHRQAFARELKAARAEIVASEKEAREAVEATEALHDSWREAYRPKQTSSESSGSRSRSSKRPTRTRTS
jgi:hypothetical protein